MKKWLSIIFLFLIPLVYGIEECTRETTPSKIPCSVISSYHPSGLCNASTSLIYNESGVNILNLTWGEYTPVCNFTFTISTIGVYHYNSSVESGVISVEREDEMIGLGVIIFLLTLCAALFWIPTKLNFTDEKWTNNLIKKMFWLFALGILTFAISVLATLADNAGLGITQDIFVFQWFGIKLLYILLLILFINILFSTKRILESKRERKRMGEDER